MAQLLAAEFGLEAAISELERSGASTDAARSQLQSLGDLQRQIASAGPATLTSLRGEIVSATTASRALAQQGRTASLAESAEIALAAVNARTRETVQRLAGDLFERRIFDPYLQFASPEEEELYRRRESERQEYIRRELARGTPEGNLNASAATVGQVVDAGAHGADRSPEYDDRLRSSTEAYNDQRASMIAAGRSTAEADARVAADVRNVLRRQGLSDTEIERRMSASSNPADALRPSAEAPQQQNSTELDDVAAALRAAGVVPPPETALPGHGLTATAQGSSQTQAASRFT